MSLADKLHLLIDNKANIKNSIANKTNNDPGNRMRDYPSIIDNIETSTGSGGIVNVEQLPDLMLKSKRPVPSSLFTVDDNGVIELLETQYCREVIFDTTLSTDKMIDIIKSVTVDLDHEGITCSVYEYCIDFFDPDTGDHVNSIYFYNSFDYIDDKPQYSDNWYIDTTYSNIYHSQYGWNPEFSGTITFEKDMIVQGYVEWNWEIDSSNNEFLTLNDKLIELIWSHDNEIPNPDVDRDVIYNLTIAPTVPNYGNCSNLYFNTNLSISEVMSEINKIENWNDNDIHYLYYSESGYKIFLVKDVLDNNDVGYAICYNDSSYHIPIWTSSENMSQRFYNTERNRCGWHLYHRSFWDLIGSIKWEAENGYLNLLDEFQEGDISYSVGTENYKITNLFSTIPFISLNTPGLYYIKNNKWYKIGKEKIVRIYNNNSYVEYYQLASDFDHLVYGERYATEFSSWQYPINPGQYLDCCINSSLVIINSRDLMFDITDAYTKNLYTNDRSSYQIELVIPKNEYATIKIENAEL